jgi:hypothetical protein
MATWKQQTQDDIPIELREYRPDDWMLGPADMSPRERWRAAQFEFLRQHQDRAIGVLDAVSVIFAD